MLCAYMDCTSWKFIESIYIYRERERQRERGFGWFLDKDTEFSGVLQLSQFAGLSIKGF